MAASTGATAGPPSGVATYQIDSSHSLAEFAVKHMMFSTVKGRFASVSGEIAFDEADPTRSSVVARADVASVDTGDPKRDGHLVSPDFFGAENHPTLTFVSTRVEPHQRAGTYRIVGDLTMRGVTREGAFEAAYVGNGVDPWGGLRAGFTAAATINRKDFGLNFNVPLEGGGVLVSDQVKISLEIEAVKQS